MKSYWLSRVVAEIKGSGAFVSWEDGKFSLKSGWPLRNLDLSRATLGGGLDRLSMALSLAMMEWTVTYRKEGLNQGWQFDAIGGPEPGAVPLVAGLLATTSIPRGFAVRGGKEYHGLPGLMVGPARPGDRCVVVTDVTIEGGNMLYAIEAARDFGCEVIAAVTLLDGTGEVCPRLKNLSIPFLALTTPRDFNIEEGP